MTSSILVRQPLLLACVIISLAISDKRTAHARTNQTSGPKSQDRETVVDGWGVHGYSGGREIGYSWYPTRREADNAKARMETTRVTGDKNYYDKVEVLPERRRFPRDQVPKSPSQSANEPKSPTEMPGGKSRGFVYDKSEKKQPANSVAPKNTGTSTSQGEPGSDSLRRGSDPGVSAPRDKNTGSRYVAPAGYEVTLSDGRKFTFTNAKEARDYVNKINENPNWRATMRDLPPNQMESPGIPSSGRNEKPSSRRPTTSPGRTTTPPTERTKSDPLEGMWSAKCGSFNFSNGRFTHVCSGDPYQGRYQVTGDRVQLTFDIGTTISGRLTGGRIDGTMHNPNKNITMPFTITR